MAGNVAEWVADHYDADYYGRPEAVGPNPTGPASGLERVVRGGSWDTVPFFTRSVHRQSMRPDATSLSVGFRCVADLEDSEFTDINPNDLGPGAEVTEAP